MVQPKQKRLLSNFKYLNKLSTDSISCSHTVCDSSYLPLLVCSLASGIFTKKLHFAETHTENNLEFSFNPFTHSPGWGITSWKLWKWWSEVCVFFVNILKFYVCMNWAIFPPKFEPFFLMVTRVSILLPSLMNSHFQFKLKICKFLINFLSHPRLGFWVDVLNFPNIDLRPSQQEAIKGKKREKLITFFTVLLVRDAAKGKGDASWGSKSGRKTNETKKWADLVSIGRLLHNSLNTIEIIRVHIPRVDITRAPPPPINAPHPTEAAKKNIFQLNGDKREAQENEKLQRVRWKREIITQAAKKSEKICIFFIECRRESRANRAGRMPVGGRKK